MFKNTICSLAILTSNWQVNKRDYIENFIPFIATLIGKKCYKKVDIEEIVSDFQNEFGLTIPYHPMQSILIRAKRRGLIQKSGKSFLPIMDNVRKFEFSSDTQKQMRQQEKVINEIRKFAKNNYKYEMTDENVEHSLIAFLKDYDLEILFASEDKGLLPEIKASKKDKFIINKYISMVYKSDPTIFRFIVDIAIGNLMANSLFYRDFSRFVGKLKDVCFYLDTPFIFRLIGLEGEQRASVYEEFIKTLHKEGACILLFRHTYEESYEILEECLNWVENVSYDPSRASAVLRYFVENNYTRIDVQRYINRIDTILSSNYIDSSNIVEKPNKQKLAKYNENEEKIQKLIIDVYKDSNPVFDEIAKAKTLLRDVDSITSIYILRKGKRPRHFKDAGHIFMTTNGGIALASRKYELSRNGGSYNIPACLTDTFVGTILWLQSPAKIFTINKRKLIADCYAALKPDAKLIKKWVFEVKKLYTEKQIDQNAYYFLRRDSMVFELLEEKTMGDVDSFDTSILTEIYNEITSEIKMKASKKYIEELESHKKTRQKYTELETDHKKLSTSLEKRASQISNIFSNVLVSLLVLIILFGVIFQIIPPLLAETPSLRIGIIVFYSLLTILNLSFGLNVFGLKNFLKKKIHLFLVTLFSGTDKS